MKIALFGAKGMIGSRILAEALSRNHQVTVIVRNAAAFENSSSQVTVLEGDANNSAKLAQLVAGHDVVISAIGPGRHANAKPQNILETTHSFLEGLPASGVKRLLLVGGAGSLEVAPGLQLIDTPEFPEAYKSEAEPARQALNVLRKSGQAVDWTFFSPSIMIEPGERTGQFRVGGDQLLVDSTGQSRISAEDFAVGIIDEAEKNQHIQQRVTVGY